MGWYNYYEFSLWLLCGGEAGEMPAWPSTLDLVLPALQPSIKWFAPPQKKYKALEPNYQGLNLAQPLVGCVTRGKLFNFFASTFLPEMRMIIKSTS